MYAEEAESDNNGTEVAYTLIIYTGSNLPNEPSKKKWSDGTMILTINPGSSLTASKKLRVKDDFCMMTEGAVTADFWLPPSIGVPKLLKVDLESNRLELMKDALYVREITVLYNRDPYRFPAKNYLYPHNPIHNPNEPSKGCPPHLLIREGAGTLKHHEIEDFIIKAREEDMKITHSMVKWNIVEDNSTALLYPGCLDVMEYDNLPRFLRFKEANYNLITELRERGREEVKINSLKNIAGKAFGVYKEGRFDSFEHHEFYLKQKSNEMGWSKESIAEAMKVAKVFRLDEEFGRQMLCGPNALRIRKVTSLEPRWAEGAVPGYALEDKTLQNALEEGYLFEVTCDELMNVPHGGGFSKMLTGTQQTWYTVLADCLLYQRSDGKLVPVLIRLENRNDREPATWWTPPDPEITDLNDPKHLAWLFAKMWFRNADMNCYALCTHFAQSHATNEVFGVAAYRNLSNAHPIFRLLQPHIQGIIPVNVQARAVLVNPGKNAFALFLSAGDNIRIVFHNHYKNFSYEDLVLPEDVKKRGVQDIPEYLYRDDTLSHWEVIQAYVGEMVNLAYLSDEDVAHDEELQNFAKEVVDIGFQGYQNGAGFPRVVSEREKLIEYITAIVFNISVFHSAVNFQTFTSYAFQPNVPSCMTTPPPEQDSEITMELILKSLPVLEVAFFAINLSNVLGTFSPVERFFLEDHSMNRLGIFGENMAVSPGQEACIQRLIEKMRQLKAKIDTRNIGRYLKYDVLSPSNTPITTQA